MAERRAALFCVLLLAAACDSGSSLDRRLLRVATQGDRKKGNELIAKGAHVDAVDEDGWTPFLWAAAHGNEDAVTALLDAGANPLAVTRREQQGALTLAAKWNRVEVVQTLLRRRLRPDSRDNIGWSALMWASLQGRTDVAGAL